MSDGKSGSHTNGSAIFPTYHIPTFGEGNPALTVTNGKESKDPSKRRKPKNNIIKSNSSFVSRVITHEALQKRLQEHSADGLYAFVNVNRAFEWLDFSSSQKDDHLTKILFTKAHALCHDINPITKSAAHIDIIMGFNYADIIWYEPISQKYSRINKNGIINPHPVTDIAWLPGSENLFLASHLDGTLVVYDKEKEDAVFIPEDATSNSETMAEKPVNGSHSVDRNSALQVKKSAQSRSQKTNPVAVWKVSNQKLNAFALSPDGVHLAVASEDGSLRIINYFTESVLDLHTSYYGGLVCVCWSPDGRYVVTGGQDDLVSIWSLADRMLVARCQGHKSWVTAVAFDPWRCDERNYRFGSVGEDCRLLLWDFSVGMLHRPKAASVRQRGSVSSRYPDGLARKDSSALTNTLTNTTVGSMGRLRSTSSLPPPEDAEDGGGVVDGDIVVHPVEPRARTAMLPPVMAKKVDEHPLAWLGFEEDCILTSCLNGECLYLCNTWKQKLIFLIIGHIRTWDRPKEGTGTADGETETSHNSS